LISYLLIGINVLVSMIAFSSGREGAISRRYLFVPSEVAEGRNVRGMVLSNFSHADIGHLLFNMLSLYFFAPVVESGLGGVGLLGVYVISGVCAALFIFMFHRRNPSYRALGASGSVSGVIFASIVVEPGMSVYFFFVPIAIPGPIFAVGYIILSTWLMRRGVGNVSHEAHIGGAVAGFILGGLLYPLGFQPLIERTLNLVGA
jgi:membrane associated rhomboid family serine protease